MGMHIDEARGDDQAGCIEHTVSLCPGKVPDFNDLVFDNAHITLVTSVAAAIHNSAVFNDNVKMLLGKYNDWEKDKQDQQPS